MLNGLLDEEADDLVAAESYERAAGHKAYRKYCRGGSRTSSLFHLSFANCTTSSSASLQC